ncbi:g5957 [Coccomyxa viridis]|uniref:G5957 protein n=1 Tax=Coccomyxa viridis TaxID=1274662 RepID=A0ABP1FY49_9CHLO
MFPNKAQSQPADYPAMPAVPIRAADSTMQSKCPADGRGVVKSSAAYLGDHKQDYIVVTPMCKRRPPTQAFNDQNCLPVATNAHHTSLQCPQRTSHPTGLCSGKQGTRPPIRPNTGVIVVTPMCTKERLPLSNRSAESANKDTADFVIAPTARLQTSQHSSNGVITAIPECTKKPPATKKDGVESADKDTTDTVKTLTAALEKSQQNRKEISNVAALLEADLQKAHAAAKEAAIKKEEDDAEALERQQEAERKEAALLKELAASEQKERTLEAEKAALVKRLAEEVNAKVAAVKTHSAREVKKLKQQLASSDTQLVAATAECQDAKSALSTKEAALTAALQTNEERTKELRKEQEASTKLRAFAATQVTKVRDLSKEKAAAEERAALAAAHREEGQRAAAEQLQEALQRNEDLAEALQKEREESAQLKAAQATQASQIESMKRDLMAAQQSAALAIQDKTVCEREAAEKLQDAHQQLENEQQVVAELRTAAEAANRRAAEAQDGACLAQVTMAAALSRAGAAEAAEATAVSAAQTGVQLPRAEAADAQAELEARKSMVTALQGQFEKMASSSAAPSSAGLLKPTATWMADQTLNVLSHPLLSPKGITGKMVRWMPFVSTVLDSAPAARTMLRSSWLGI